MYLSLYTPLIKGQYLKAMPLKQTFTTPLVIAVAKIGILSYTAQELQLFSLF